MSLSKLSFKASSADLDHFAVPVWISLSATVVLFNKYLYSSGNFQYVSLFPGGDVSSAMLTNYRVSLSSSLHITCSLP